MDPHKFKVTLELIKSDYLRVSSKKPSLYRYIYKTLSNAGFRAVFLYRIGRWLKLNNLNFLASMCQRLMHHYAHCWINVTADIGAGFLVAHVGGLIIGGGTVIGTNCDVRQNVTFGGNFNKQDSKGRSHPLLKDNISIGAGAVIVGPVTIESNSIVGANSVVTRNVPPNVIVFGVPAEVIKERWSEDIGRKL